MIPALLSTLASIPDPLLAAFGALFGAVVLEAIRAGISRKKETREDKKDAQDDLREDITKLKDQLEKVEQKRDEWREKYFEVTGKLQILQAMVAAAQLKEQGMIGVSNVQVEELLQSTTSEGSVPESL